MKHSHVVFPTTIEIPKEFFDLSIQTTEIIRIPQSIQQCFPEKSEVLKELINFSIQTIENLWIP